MKKSLIFGALLALSLSSIAQSTPAATKVLTIEMERGNQTRIFDRSIVSDTGFIRHGRTLRYVKEVNPVTIEGDKKYEVVSGEVEDGVTISYNEKVGNFSLVYDVEIKDYALPEEPEVKVQSAYMKNVSFSFPLEVTSEKKLMGSNDDWKIYYKVEQNK